MADIASCPVHGPVIRTRPSPFAGRRLLRFSQDPGRADAVIWEKGKPLMTKALFGLGVLHPICLPHAATH